MRRLVPALGIVSVGAAALMAGDLLPYHRRAIVRCAPPQQFQYVRHNPSNPVTKETFTGNLLPVAIDPTAPPPAGSQPAVLPGPGAAIKYWQLSESEIRSEHCSISNATLWVDDNNGEWRLSFTVAQNPFVGPARQATPAARFLRNKFFVKVRAVGAQPAASNAEVSPLTGPEMFCIEIPPFWIDRGETRPLSYQGQLSELDRRRMKYVDRLLVDFSFE
jgi:hypothetical protein